MKKLLLTLTLFTYVFSVIAQVNCNDKIFVTTSGTGSGLAPNSPTSLTSGLALITAARNHVLIASGTYNISGKVSVPSNAILDGRYTTGTTEWTKSSANTTQLNITPAYQTNTAAGVTTGNYVAMELINSSNVYLKDLNIDNMASTTGSTGNRGRNMYGVYTSNSSNFYFSRLSITTNNASNGLNGSSGANGVNGSNGLGGHDGDNDDANNCDDGGSNGIHARGGAGGGGTVGGSGAQQCNGELGGNGGAATGRNGGGGGGGGSGERYNGDTAGMNGGRGGTANGVAGGDGGAGNNSDDGQNGGEGAIGANGANATTTWSANNRPTNYTYSNYFVPGAQSNSGSNGSGGSGGGGGGGGSNQSGFASADDGSGAGGGGGGGGGQGGAGGTGGYGGGGNFGVYTNGGASKVLYDVLFSLGNAGTGGTGGARGDRGIYGNGASGGQESEVGNGGAGGRGGLGGYGGRGRDGANGVKANQYGTTLSGTSVPNPTTLTTTAYGGCTNSVFDYTKGSGSWSGLSFVNDLNATSSSYSNSSSPAKVYYTASGHKNITVAGTNYRNFDYVGTVRPVPVITLSNSSICVGGTIDLSASDWGSQTQYDWKVYRGANTSATQVFSSTSADPSGTGPYTTAGSYLVKYQVKETCCSWSIPVYETFTVVTDPVAPTITRSPNNATVCLGTTLTATSSGGSGGVSCNNEYRFRNNAGTWSSWSTTISSFTANAAGTWQMQTRRACSGNGCGTVTGNTVSWVVEAPPTSASAGADAAVCLETVFTLNGSNPAPGSGSWSWSPSTPTYVVGNASTPNAQVEFNTSGSYTGTWTVSGNCPTSSDNVTIEVNNPLPIVMNDATGDCVSNSVNNWVHIYDVNRNIIASVNDNNQNLGQVDASVFYHSGNAFEVTTASGACGQQAVLNRNFVINSAVAPTSNVDVRLYFTDAELDNLKALAGCGDPNGCEDDDDVCSITDLVVTQITGLPSGQEDGAFVAGAGNAILHGTPANSGRGNATFGANYVQISVSSFSEFWIHGSEHGATLPVELTKFDATAVDNTYIKLNWQTVTEINNEGFEIERSTNGVDFNNIGYVDGNGNSTAVHNYMFDDEEVNGNIIYYYRLKQVDFDGDYEYSQIVSASLDSDVDFSIGEIIPNPSKENTQVRISISTIKEETIDISVFNAIGVKVLDSEQTLTKGNNKFSINTTSLASGTYFINFEGDFGRQAKKLVIIK